MVDLPPARALGSGLLMGGADAIPGVSGGTVALILGIYQQFIDALATMVRSPVLLRSKEGRREISRALRMLVPLGIGVALAYLAATKLLVGKGDERGLIQDPNSAPYCYAFFFGLVLASLREPWRRIRRIDGKTVLFALAGALVAFVFSGMPYLQEEPKTWMLLYGGALAISVMLLPGISGSLLLLMLNQYQTVVESIHDMKIVPIAVFASGLVLGVALFIPCLRFLLRNAHDVTMAVLTGLMAGSLRALWPWKENYEPKLGPMTNRGPADSYVMVLGMTLVGVAVVLLLGAWERRATQAKEGLA